MRPSVRVLVTPHAVPRPPSEIGSPYAWLAPTNAQAGPSRSSTGRLAGKRVAIKENISYAAAPATASSSILHGYRPPFNATCVEDLLAEGAYIVGTTKMDEFGMGSLTSHLPAGYTPVHNPSGPPSTEKRSAGGSSGGSAAAVAEGSCWAALGTDTGGSVRLPAAYCGVVGLKPSYGMISRYGVIAYADSLDCVGILSSSVEDAQTLFDVLSHPDSRDMTSPSAASRSRATSLLESHLSSASPRSSFLSGLRIGLPSELLHPSPPPPSLIAHLISLGATIHPVSLPALSTALPAYYVLASAEASSNLARFGGGWFGAADEATEQVEGESGEERRRRVRTAGFGREVKKRILAGTHALSADEFNNTYLKALHLRRLLRHQLSNSFRLPHSLFPALPSSPSEGVDVLLHPTAIRTAPPLPGAATGPCSNSSKGQEEYMQDLLTVPASLAGLPAMSVPAGRGEDGWPVGMSVMGQWGTERLVFSVGKAIEYWRQESG